MIFTFYSYKGGVGRTMALANVAELFYQAGLKVLMVDWDLEAPGLERFFFTGEQMEQVLSRPGLMDLLQDYKEQMVKEWRMADNKDVSLPFAPLSAFMQNVRQDPAGRGQLWLLAAGKRSQEHYAKYARSVLTFDWQDFYQSWEGGRYIEWLRQQFEQMADVVLIDSRTGVTEIGGVCIYQLADTVVMFCAPNQQSLDGTYEMARNFTDLKVQGLRRGRPLNVLIIPARLERAEGELLDEFQKKFIDLFKDFVPQTKEIDIKQLWRLGIPYIPKYAFTEAVAVRESERASAKDMATAFRGLGRVMEHLRLSQPMADEQLILLDESDYEAIAAEMRKEPETILEKRVKKPVVLHLSDLQFGSLHAFEDDQKALEKLEEDIDRYEQEEIPRPNIVVVSGDLADTGGAKGDEYGAVTRFLEGLCQHLSIDRRYVVLVPGNHDVNWDEARRLEALKKQGDRGLTAAIKEFLYARKSEPVGPYASVNYLQRFGKYAEFFNRFYRREDGTTHYICDLAIEEGFNIIYNFHSEWGIAFLALNSCEREDHHNENHYGHISPSVLKSALGGMKATVAAPCVKAVVFHHNALVGGGEDRLRNFRSDILPALSQAGFSLVLHGHTHKPDVDDLGPEPTGGARVRVVGAGSVSVARAQRPGSDREGQVPNQYWVLAFELGDERRQFTAYARQYAPNLPGKYTQGKWIPYYIFTVAGKPSDRRTFGIGTI